MAQQQRQQRGTKRSRGSRAAAAAAAARGNDGGRGRARANRNPLTISRGRKAALSSSAAAGAAAEAAKATSGGAPATATAVGGRAQARARARATATAEGGGKEGDDAPVVVEGAGPISRRVSSASTAAGDRPDGTTNAAAPADSTGGVGGSGGGGVVEVSPTTPAATSTAASGGTPLPCDLTTLLRIEAALALHVRRGRNPTGAAEPHCHVVVSLEEFRRASRPAILAAAAAGGEAPEDAAPPAAHIDGIEDSRVVSLSPAKPPPPARPERGGEGGDPVSSSSACWGRLVDDEERALACLVLVAPELYRLRLSSDEDPDANANVSGDGGSSASAATTTTTKTKTEDADQKKKRRRRGRKMALLPRSLLGGVESGGGAVRDAGAADSSAVDGSSSSPRDSMGGRLRGRVVLQLELLPLHHAHPPRSPDAPRVGVAPQRGDDDSDAAATTATARRASVVVDLGTARSRMDALRRLYQSRILLPPDETALGRSIDPIVRARGEATSSRRRGGNLSVADGGAATPSPPSGRGRRGGIAGTSGAEPWGGIEAPAESGSSLLRTNQVDGDGDRSDVGNVGEESNGGAGGATRERTSSSFSSSSSSVAEPYIKRGMTLEERVRARAGERDRREGDLDGRRKKRRSDKAAEMRRRQQASRSSSSSPEVDELKETQSALQPGASAIVSEAPPQKSPRGEDDAVDVPGDDCSLYDDGVMDGALLHLADALWLYLRSKNSPSSSRGGRLPAAGNPSTTTTTKKKKTEGQQHLAASLGELRTRLVGALAASSGGAARRRPTPAETGRNLVALADALPDWIEVRCALGPGHVDASTDGSIGGGGSGRGKTSVVGGGRGPGGANSRHVVFVVRNDAAYYRDVVRRTLGGGGGFGGPDRRGGALATVTKPTPSSTGIVGVGDSVAGDVAPTLRPPSGEAGPKEEQGASGLHGDATNRDGGAEVKRGSDRADSASSSSSFAPLTQSETSRAPPLSRPPGRTGGKLSLTRTKRARLLASSSPALAGSSDRIGPRSGEKECKRRKVSSSTTTPGNRGLPQDRANGVATGVEKKRVTFAITPSPRQLASIDPLPQSLLPQCANNPVRNPERQGEVLKGAKVVNVAVGAPNKMPSSSSSSLRINESLTFGDRTADDNRRTCVSQSKTSSPRELERLLSRLNSGKRI